MGVHRLLVFIVLAAVAAGLAGTATPDTGPRPGVIAIDQNGFRLGRLVWSWQAHDRSVTLADFIATFGRPSTCREPVRFDANVVWARVAIRGDFTTLGGSPRPGETGCTVPRLVHPDTIDVFQPTWRTERGLHVGATLARLRALYPRASNHRDGWWLVVRRKDPLFGTYGQLVAAVRDGRISQLRLVLHAQGD
jgi:hypothetical protein